MADREFELYGYGAGRGAPIVAALPRPSPRVEQRRRGRRLRAAPATRAAERTGSERTATRCWLPPHRRGCRCCAPTAAGDGGARRSRRRRCAAAPGGLAEPGAHAPLACPGKRRRARQAGPSATRRSRWARGRGGARRALGRRARDARPVAAPAARSSLIQGDGGRARPRRSRRSTARARGWSSPRRCSRGAARGEAAPLQRAHALAEGCGAAPVLAGGATALGRLDAEPAPARRRRPHRHGATRRDAGGRGPREPRHRAGAVPDAARRRALPRLRRRQARVGLPPRAGGRTGRLMQERGQAPFLQPATRIELCGPLSVVIDGDQRASELRGRQGRMLLAYLVLNRHRAVRRDELADVLWAESGTPEGGEALLAPPLSRLRRALGDGRLHGRGELWLARRRRLGRLGGRARRARPRAGGARLGRRDRRAGGRERGRGDRGRRPAARARGVVDRRARRRARRPAPRGFGAACRRRDPARGGGAARGGARGAQGGRARAVQGVRARGADGGAGRARQPGRGAARVRGRARAAARGGARRPGPRSSRCTSGCCARSPRRPRLRPPHRRASSSATRSSRCSGGSRPRRRRAPAAPR